MKISSLFIFGNGMVAVFDEVNKQVPEFQGFLFDVDFKEMVVYMDSDTRVFINGNNKTDIYWWLQKKGIVP